MFVGEKIFKASQTNRFDDEREKERKRRSDEKSWKKNDDVNKWPKSIWDFAMLRNERTLWLLIKHMRNWWRGDQGKYTWTTNEWRPFDEWWAQNRSFSVSMRMKCERQKHTRHHQIIMIISRPDVVVEIKFSSFREFVLFILYRQELCRTDKVMYDWRFVVTEWQPFGLLMSRENYIRFSVTVRDVELVFCVREKSSKSSDAKQMKNGQM